MEEVTVLCGRDRELAALDAAAARANGATEIVLLRGDSGMGKSALVAEWARRFRGAGGSPCFGYCFDFVGQPPPLASFIAALREVLGTLSRAARDRVIADAGRPELAALLPELRAPDQPAPAPAADHVYDTVLRTVRAAARELRLAIVLEDLHWADALTLDVVSNLVHGLRTVPLLFVLTFRDEPGAGEGHLFEPALLPMSRLGHATTLTLAPLDDDDIADQLRGLGGDALEPAVVAAIVRRAAGNPFYAEQLAIAHALGLSSLPDRLVESLRARLRPLSASAREIVRACAAYSGAIHHELLAAACGASPDAIADAVREALANGIVVRTAGGYQIRHDLFREVVAGDEIPYDCARRHRRIATTLAAHPELCLEGPHAEPALVARHWRECGDARAAFDAALRAAATAESLAAYGDAYEHLAYAVEIWTRVTDAPTLAACSQSDLCRRAAMLATEGSRVDEARAMFERALAVLPDDARAATRAALFANLAVTERDYDGTDQTEALVARAEALVGEDSNVDACEALTTLAKVRIRESRLGEGARLAERAVAIARRETLTDALVNALVCLGAATGFVGDSGTAHRALAEAIANARGTGNRDLEWWARYTDVVVRNVEEHFGEAVELGRALLSEVENGRAGPVPVIRLLGILGEIHTNTGDIEGLAHTTHRLRQCPSNRGWDRSTRIAEVRLTLARGALDDAVRAADELVQDVGPFPDPQHSVAVRQLQAEVKRWSGDSQGARVAIDACLDCALRAEDRMYRRESLLEGLRIEAMVANESRWRRDVRLLETATTRATTLVSHATTRDDADRRFRRAIEAYADRVATGGDANRFAAVAAEFEQVPRLIDALQLRITEAEIRLEHEDRSHAKRVIQDAHGCAVRIGATHVANAVEDLARRARLQLSPEPGTASLPVGALTTRERDVLDQMARGLTNRQISEVLFVSHRTVGTHVSSILAKFGARTRGEAVALSREAGVLD